MIELAPRFRRAVATDARAIAVFPPYRGRGLGRRLPAVAYSLAAAHGRQKASLIVAGSNEDAIRLYDHEGFRTIHTEPIVPHPRLHIAGDWLLMTRQV